MTNEAESKAKLQLSEDKIAQLLHGKASRSVFAALETTQVTATEPSTFAEAGVLDTRVRDKQIRIDKMSTQDSPHILNERSIRDGARPVVVSIPDVHNTDGWQINLERDGDIIRVIHIACGCGEQLSIQCDYASPKK